VDRQALIGFVLIALILIVWMTMNAPQSHPPEQKVDKDTAQSQTQVEQQIPIETKPQQLSAPSEAFGNFFTLGPKDEKVIIVETDLYHAEITTEGGLIRKWELKNYTTWDGWPVSLVDFPKGGDFSLLFTSTDGKLINTRNLDFETDFRHWHREILTGNDSLTIDLSLKATNGGRLVKRLTFYNDSYSFDATLLFERMEDVISGFEYQIVWETGLPFAEHNSVDEASFAMAYAYSGKELAEIDAAHHAEPEKMSITGVTDWVATRNKYFAVAIIPSEKKGQGAYLEGIAENLPDNGIKENYSIGILMPFKSASDASASFRVFLGPLDFDIVKGYQADLDQIMSLGAAWIIRPISEWVIIPLFQFLRWFIPNYGVVIIVFSIIIKIALHPLTKTSMKSMKKMQALQPMMEEIRMKYKDDSQKMNKQIMQLYKDYGVNPAGGCLPILLQLPILYALWTVFRSAIELRQANFVWWITDLSVPDVIVRLPFSFFGIQDVSGLALLMGITMFIQQKMTIKDPRQKMMIWLMPIMLTLLFNGFPSGLNLYYFVFNLLSIAQQMWINKQHGEQPLRKVDERKKSGGIMNRITKDLPKLRR
jgi:YidC/Oxa1 family membrane protein insertase